MACVTMGSQEETGEREGVCGAVGGQAGGDQEKEEQRKVGGGGESTGDLHQVYVKILSFSLPSFHKQPNLLHVHSSRLRLASPQ